MWLTGFDVINQAHKRGEATGLTEDELAFYDALAEDESAKEIMGPPKTKMHLKIFQ